MEILEAAEFGMCFGVRDALRTLERVEDPTAVTIHGELVHNREVLADLDRRGFRASPETDRPIPSTPAVLITAHGISEHERQRLRDARKTLIDTTCPLVRRAHDAAQELQRDGRRVIVIGKPQHVEVLGIVGDLRAAIVVTDVDDVCRWPESRLGVVCQTTTTAAAAETLLTAIRHLNPHADIRHIDTICSPTKARVAALHQLLTQVTVLVVVGGHASNNTRQLVETATRCGVPAHQVEHAGELRREWFVGHRTVGLTAGTSTLDRTIAAVRARLESFRSRA